MTERVNASTILDRNLEAGRADKPALIVHDAPVSYGELARLTAGAAAYLRELGVEREQRVLMILDDCAAFPATFLGAMRIGAVPVPVNPMDRVDNYAYYLEDSYARVLVVEAALVPKLEPVLSGQPDLHVLVVEAGADAVAYPTFDAAVAAHAGELQVPL